MKKYKLIKEYPGSPKLGTKIFNDGVFKGHYYMHVNGIKTHLGTIEPYKYPEFWEEVVEKDYEILSFIANQDIVSIKKGTILTKAYNSPLLNNISFIGHNCNVKNYTVIQAEENKLLNNSAWDIHSVKRLSDGEVFTIGDNIVPPKDIHEFYKYKKYPIRSFYIDRDERIRAIIENGCHLTIDKLTHRKSLFTTEDGVDICEGDKYFKVLQNFCFFQEKAGKTFSNSHLSPKYFSTKEAAFDYIIENKPCLSLNDLRNSCISEALYKDPSIINKMKDLVKSKL